MVQLRVYYSDGRPYATFNLPNEKGIIVDAAIKCPKCGTAIGIDTPWHDQTLECHCGMTMDVQLWETVSYERRIS